MNAMSERPEDLPEFEQPPVEEVAIGVQFERLAPFRQGHIGLFWHEIRTDYPVTVDQPRLETPLEVLGETQPTLSFQVEFLDSPPTHRSWFVSADDTMLVQVQDDRFVHNWRFRGAPYPRFEPLLARFWAQFEVFRRTLETSGIQGLRPLQAETIYVNWIEDVQPAEFLRPFGDSTVHVPGVGPEPDAQIWSARYPVLHDDKQVGRLVVECKRGHRVVDLVQSTGYLLTLTYRSPLKVDQSIRDAQEQFILGRNAIVRTFTDLTTELMHVRWGRTK